MNGRYYIVSLFLLTGSCLPSALSNPDLSSLALSSLSPSTSTASSPPATLTITDTVPLRGFIVNPTQSIAVQFNQAVLAASCTAGGTIGAATLTYSNNTVTATPATTWSTGISRTLTLTGCQDESATLTGGGSMEFQIPASVMYIDDAGNDGNAGTTAAPRLTVNGALAGCASPCVIIAAGGTYARETIAAPGDFALIGGYSDDFSTWNATANPTIFSDTTVPAGVASTAPDSALFIQGATLAYLRSIQIRANSNVAAIYTTGLRAQNSIIIAYAVQATGCTGACSAALESEGIYFTGSGALNLFLSVIDGGNCAGAGCTTAGLRDAATSGQVLNAIGTTFRGGTATGASSSNGLLLSQAKTAGSRLEGCTITGGQSMIPRGALLTSFAGPVVRNTFHGGIMAAPGGYATAAQFSTHADSINSNVFFGGVSLTTGAVGTGNAVAALCANCTGQIVNNVFDAGKSFNGTNGIYGLRLTGTSTPDLRNNEFTGWTGSAYNYCLFLDTASLPTTLQSNAFIQCLTTVFRMGTVYDVCAGGEIGTGACTTELIPGTGDANNILLATTPGWISHDYTALSFDYRFVTDGTALCSVTQAGQTISASDSDRSFQNRTVPWSIGPFEFDGSCQ